MARGDVYKPNGAANGNTTGTRGAPSSQGPGDQGNRQFAQVIQTRIGIYGWRKILMYVLLCLVAILTIINIGMLVFVYRSMNLDTKSAGPLYFYDDRLLVRGRAEFQRGLAASNISGFDNTTLLVESNQRILLRSFEDPQSTERSELELDGVDVNVDTGSFSISYNGDEYFSSSPQETVIASNDIFVESDTGLRVDGGILTPSITNDYQSGAGLSIESIGQDLVMQGSEAVRLESQFGTVDITGGQSVQISSQQGDVSLDGRYLFLPDLPGAGNNNNRQLCICRTNRRLFSHPNCRSDLLSPNPCI